jgi:uncharacterized protein (DUF1499 family)
MKAFRTTAAHPGTSKDLAMNLSKLPLLLTALALLVLLIAGPGVRLELWDFRFGLQLMRYAAFAGLGAGALALIGLLWPRVRRQGAGLLSVALAIGLVVVALPWLQLRQARSVPPIHDISTDLQQPPEFSAIVELRGADSNPLDRADPALPDQQRAAYPDVRPAIIAAAPDAAFERALEVADTLGWEIVSTDPTAGLIEATDTTLWFGFKDDVAIRIRAEGEGSRIDLRSVSRVGRSDVGANARRIRAFLELIESPGT